MNANNDTNQHIFCASFSVRVDTKRIRFELADATKYGGSAGFYRVRINRKWHDAFLDAAQIAMLVVDVGLGQPLAEQSMPTIKQGQRCNVILERDAEGFPIRKSKTFTGSPPIRAYDGKWKISVCTPDEGVHFVDCDDVEVRR